MGGWRFVTGAEPGTVTSTSTSFRCDDMINTETNYGGFTWTDPYGNKHMFNVTTHRDKTNCDVGDTPTADGPAYDSSGYHMYLTNYTSAKVYAPDGSQVFPQVQDANGNYFSYDGNGNVIGTRGTHRSP